MLPDDDGPPDLERYISQWVVQNEDEDHQIVLIPQPDRRKNRVPMPDCPHCGSDDEVHVVGRGGGSLVWRCGPCQWSWVVMLPPECS